ncbi:hypothetical protein DFO67_10458 [Modicisalibacter xianhensis]|uniref:Uncharacterized protein n=1 Tax=Modicisalibacter xianhensis TaxID=442341 RepID=A0A4R8G2X4_9GAMM|nr:hypothetical protein [Halomonas xianhensis]TDX30803.1 hypothetical protein DFO67_10458 [Halomonas xianhensis]
MAKVGVSLKIDVTKIDKARLFKGQKGTYLDATVFVDLGEADQYGNHGMITQDVTKEERQAGTRGEILGNCKVFYRDDQGQQEPNYGGYQQAQANHAARQNQPTPGQQGMNGPQVTDFDDEIPFRQAHYLIGG